MQLTVVSSVVVFAGAINLFGDTLHVEDHRTNEVFVAANGGRYAAYFDSEIEIPNFRPMPALLVSQFVELVTGQKTNELRAAVWNERMDFFAACKRDARFDGDRFVRETTAKLLYQDKRFVSYRINYCHLEGCPCGAANEGETTNVTFDCKLGKRLYANDIVSKANNRKLLNLIRLKLSQQFKGYEFESFAEPDGRSDEQIADAVVNAGKGDVGTPWVSDNFCITSEGIEWTFMPCEIVCAAHGTITVKVAWKDLTGIIVDGFFPCNR